MNDISSLRAVGFPMPMNVGPGAEPTGFASEPDDVFDLIDRTVEAMRSLKQENEIVEAREQACRMQLELDRAAWRSDLQTLKRTVEDCMARAVAAEREAEEARAQVRLAMQVCREIHEREAVAIGRAEKADARVRQLQEQLTRLHDKLTTEFNTFIIRHAP
jgi:chromosome segregation ATPase